MQAQLPRFLVELPGGGAPPALGPWLPGLPQPPATDWDTLIAEVVSRGADVPEVTWCKPGEGAEGGRQTYVHLVGLHMRGQDC